ncbi:MAG: hypothetical protein Kow0089_12770 [Desulfobulbaceae bacterium]
MAVFPLLDLTKDANGVNFVLTESVRRKAVEDGFDLIPESDIMDFMVRNRIRTLGTLSSHELTKLRKELGADYALLGTVCQLEEMPKAKVSLSLQLVRTSDEEVVWARTSDLHKDDLITMLGLGDPETLNDIYQEYFSSIFDTMQGKEGRPEAETPFVNLLYADLRPRYVKPGERMEFEARFFSNVGEENFPSFVLQIDGKEFEVELDDEARFIKATFLAHDVSGSYKANLVARFPSGESQVLELGDYTVDGRPPELTVNLFGTTIDGKVYFSRDLVITAGLAVPERLQMWEIKVFDDAGDVLVTQAGEGQFPRRVFWNGQDDNREMTPDGRYRIVVTVWDRAMNKASAEAFAYHRHTKPEMVFYGQREGDRVIVEMENAVGYPMSFWFLKAYRKNGELVGTEVGSELPPSVTFDVAGMSELETLELVFAGRDVFGNNNYTIIPDLLNLVKKEVETEVVPESQWLENF